MEVEQLHEELNALLDFRKEKVRPLCFHYIHRAVSLSVVCVCLQEDILRKMRVLEDTIEAERADHRREVQECERKVVQEKERLKAEMKQKLAEFKTSMMKMTDDQLESVRLGWCCS